VSLHHYIESIWWRQQSPPCWLRLFEPIYARISRHHLNKRSKQCRQPPLPLISIGNITAGGSGKTPFVVWLSGILLEHGYHPVILCRGDGGNSSAIKQVLPDSKASEAGDEAVMLAQLSGCPVIAARDRLLASRTAADYGDVILLDDGFQYRQLGRCCDIVLVPTDGIGNGHQIPAGPLREPVTALQRADLVVRTGHATNRPVTPVGSGKQWQWTAEAGPLQDMQQTGQPEPVLVSAMTAIARPQRFFDDLQSRGLQLASTRSWPDHHPFSQRDVKLMLAEQHPVVVTAKDAVKLLPLWPRHEPLWVLPQQGNGEDGLATAIIAYLVRFHA